MAEKFGIKETKEALHFICTLAQASIESATSGKFDSAALLKHLQALTLLPSVINGVTVIPSELSDLSDAEKAELYAVIEKDLKIPHQLADMIVKKVLKILLEFSDFVRLIK